MRKGEVVDISRIRSFLPLPSKLATKKSSKDMEKDPQGGHASHYDRERKLSLEEVEEAKEILESTESFSASGLSIEVRDQNGRFFLDIFDSRGEKLKTINPLGIIDLLRAKNAYLSGHRPISILDRRV